MGNRFIRLRPYIVRLIMAFVLFPAGVLAGEAETPSREFRIPMEPGVPAVDIKEKKDKGNTEDIPVTAETVKGEALTGSLILSFNVLEIDFTDNGVIRRESIPIASIESIEFIRWHGTERRKNEFLFHPSQIRLIMKDKKVYTCARNIPKLNKLLLKNFKGSRFLFSYFYDYRKNNAWNNSGEADMHYPETNPPAGTLLRITFTKTENKNWLERLLLK